MDCLTALILFVFGQVVQEVAGLPSSVQSRIKTFIVSISSGKSFEKSTIVLVIFDKSSKLLSERLTLKKGAILDSYPLLLLRFRS